MAWKVLKASCTEVVKLDVCEPAAVILKLLAVRVNSYQPVLWQQAPQGLQTGAEQNYRHSAFVQDNIVDPSVLLTEQVIWHRSAGVNLSTNVGCTLVSCR